MSSIANLETVASRKAFIQVPASALDADISSSAFRLYVRLLRHAGQSDFAYPKPQTLAEKMQLSDKQVGRLLAELREAGMIADGTNEVPDRKGGFYTAIGFFILDKNVRRSGQKCPEVRTKMSIAYIGEKEPLEKDLLNFPENEISSLISALSEATGTDLELGARDLRRVAKSLSKGPSPPTPDEILAWGKRKTNDRYGKPTLKFLGDRFRDTRKGETRGKPAKRKAAKYDPATDPYLAAAEASTAQA